MFAEHVSIWIDGDVARHNFCFCLIEDKIYISRFSDCNHIMYMGTFEYPWFVWHTDWKATKLRAAQLPHQTVYWSETLQLDAAWCWNTAVLDCVNLDLGTDYYETGSLEMFALFLFSTNGLLCLFLWLRYLLFLAFVPFECFNFFFLFSFSFSLMLS